MRGEAMSCTTMSFDELCDKLGEVNECERRTERILCWHLAALADRFERGAPELGAHVDVYQFARLRFRGMGVRKTRERVRVGRALRRLPLIDEAFLGGEVGYARVREVTRVATSDDEGTWL